MGRKMIFGKKNNKSAFRKLNTSDFFNDLVTINKDEAAPKVGAVGQRNGDKIMNIDINLSNVEDFPNVSGIPSSNGTTVKGSGTFAGLFRENRTLSKGMPMEVFDCNDGDVVLEKEDCVPIQDKWGFCLVGCFTGRFPGGKAVHDLKDSWGVACKVIPHTNYWTIFKFNSLEDREKVYQGGPYSTFGKTLMLKKVDDGTFFDDDLFLDIPIWVKFYDVPLIFWNPRGLGKISSKLGKPLYSDQVTNECTSAKYARILVEVDMRKELIFDYVVKTPWGSYTQKVCYENCPEYCFRCKKFGHYWDECEKFGGKQNCENVIQEDASSDLELSSSDAQLLDDHSDVKDHQADNSSSETPPVLPEETPPPVLEVPAMPTESRLVGDETTDDVDDFSEEEVESEPSSDADSNFIEVWIKFFDVPSRYYNSSGLEKLASMLGTPLKTDEETARFLNSSSARVLVLIDARKEQPLFEFKVNLPNGKSYKQRVQYENYLTFLQGF